MKPNVSAAGIGVAGGLAGTVTMSVLLFLAQKMGLLGRFPPERITAKALDAIGLKDVNKKAEEALAMALHVGFGSTCGAAFGLLRRRLRPPLTPVPQGFAYGMLIWLTSYKGWLPALGLMPPPEEDRLARPTVMILAHLLYGATLSLVVAHQADPPATREQAA